MDTTTRCAMILLAALAAAPSAAVAPAAPTSAEAVAAFGQQLDSYIRRLRASTDVPPGTAIVVVHGDRTMFEKAYGTRDKRSGAPLTLDTPMYNGSVTKAYTGVLAAMLDAEGILPLSASVKDVWSIDLPPPLDARKVTAERLLSHSSGIDVGGLNFRSVSTGQVDARYVPVHLARFAKPEPSAFEYDNYGPFIWSAMAEKRTGMSWRDLLQTRILRPLGLTRSSARLEDFGADGVARCHPRVAGRWRPDPPKPTATLNAAGGMFASPRNEARFLQAVITDGASAGGVIPAAVLRRSRQRTAAQDTSIWGMHRDGYGLGWDLGTFNGHRFVSRSGGYPGCRAISLFVPELGLGIVAMSNGGIGANTLHAAIIAQALDYWVGAPGAQAKANQRIAQTRAALAAAVREADAGDPRLARSRPADAAALSAALGSYRNDRLGDAQVRADGKGVRLVIGVFSAPLLQLSGDSFLVLDDPEGDATSFSFIRDAGGRVIAFMLDDDRYERVKS